MFRVFIMLSLEFRDDLTRINYLPTEKPLKIELMFDPAKAVRSVPLSSRVTPAVNNNGTVPMEGVQRLV